MDTTSLIVAAVGGIATMAAPLVGVWAAKRYQDKELKIIPAERKAALDGEWRGTSTQRFGSTPEESIEVNVTATLKVIRKEVVGEIHYEAVSNEGKLMLVLEAKGGFLYERFIQLHYKNKKTSVMQFGSAVLELNASGNELNGRFVGYGSLSEELVFGEITLQKQP